MRLWHYKIIPYLPDSQLIAQWRELNTIYAKQPSHILINYVYDYPKQDLLCYSLYVLREMDKRGFVVRNWENFDTYFDIKIIDGFSQIGELDITEPFKVHHTDRYLKQCFVNLQEKYDRGQKDFSDNQYGLLLGFMCEEVFKDEPR